MGALERLAEGERMATSTPNLDKWTEEGNRVTAAWDFVDFLRGKGAVTFGKMRTGDYIAEWIGCDPKVLEEEKRWVARQAQKAAQRSREEKP